MHMQYSYSTAQTNLSNFRLSMALLQMGKDGRVRPMIIHTRRNASHWFPSSSNPPPYETTFPVNPNPITAKISPKVGNMSHTVHEEVTPRNEKLVTAMEREQNNVSYLKNLVFEYSIRFFTHTYPFVAAWGRCTVRWHFPVIPDTVI